MRDFLHYKDADINLHHVFESEPVPSAFRMHSHEKCELYCFLSGKGRFLIEGSEYPLHRGDILVMRPAEAHCIQLEPGHPYERLSIHFSSSLFDWMDPDRQLLQAFWDREAGRFNLFSPSDFPTTYYRECLFRAVTPSAQQRLQVLTSLAPLLNELRMASHQRDITHQGAEDSLMFRVIRYINNHLSERLTLDVLCETFFISKPQLCRLFKQTTGAPIGEYITVKRLSAARQLLINGVPPTHVHTRCGYVDYSAFYRAYIKYFGLSPSMERIRLDT